MTGEASITDEIHHSHFQISLFGDKSIRVDGSFKVTMQDTSSATRGGVLLRRMPLKIGHAMVAFSLSTLRAGAGPDRISRVSSGQSEAKFSWKKEQS